VTQMNHQKKLNHQKARSQFDVHLPTESDQAPALSKADKCPLPGQIKKARQQAVVLLLREVGVVMMNKNPNCRW
jgi:hypothetical protein